MRFDPVDLRLFLLVLEAGSITHGAARAHLSLPSASERLRGMEETSGVALLERSRRGVAPTPAGEALAHHARLILRQIEQMRGELKDYAEGVQATIRLLANTAAITEFLPDALAPWLARHPRIEVELKERQSTEIVTAVAAGRADIGVVSAAVDTGALALRAFAVDRLVLVLARDHPLAGARRVGFAEVLDMRFVGLSAGSALQEHIEGQAARLGRPLHYRARVPGFWGVCRMAAHGAGPAIVPETAARRYRRAMPIAVLRLTDDWATRRLALCWREEEPLAPATRDLVAHLEHFPV